MYGYLKVETKVIKYFPPFILPKNKKHLVTSTEK